MSVCAYSAAGKPAARAGQVYNAAALPLREAGRLPWRASRIMARSSYVCGMSSAGSMPSPQLLEEYCQFFRLLSEPSRLQLLCRLKQGPMDVASLIEATGFSQSHISRQLGLLQRAGLVSCEREGVRTIWSADNALVDDLCALVQTRLRQRLESQLKSFAVS